ncbi:hypothetical protein [Mycobacterium sp. SMC-4]|uniref:hypothetical protein n=1 Tax=Mycobacterium sp. SMC-4 TaxID=2857059 RepID=UPI0021B4797C|nr:hypothetical protein [Mycobacterium sp. SMC-4]UXA17916.1 hypothetical protein KXD98_25085 [Mycobacterium sp. SMC-4]
MSLFWIVTVIAVVVAVAYLTFGVRAFARVRRDILHAAATRQTEDVAELPDAIHRGFVWKAFGGVIGSVAVIVLLSVNGVFWYLPIFLAIGSAVAVITAFIIDERGNASTSSAL